MPPGSTFHPDLSFDGKKLAFSYFKDSKELADRRYLLWEIGLGGSGLRQITGSAKDLMAGRDGRNSHFIEDFDPYYLPDGRFTFASTRVMTTVRCVNNARWVLSMLQKMVLWLSTHLPRKPYSFSCWTRMGWP
ncbi:hypothetical protein BVY04_05400 [bacterium M21]|nr:hypothetical protein BVY04_05400 [bacterium M21]